jgi:hypothetical protein
MKFWVSQDEIEIIKLKHKDAALARLVEDISAPV